jgi:LPS export ABC transporter protein LptC
MNTRRSVLLLLLLAVAAAAALWFSRARQGGPESGEPQTATQLAYVYKANGVVLRQMRPDGRLAFQVEARQITQLPDGGSISAQGLTLYHDPPGTEPGGPGRWTLTADSGELPAEGGVVTLAGHVQAHGKWGGRTAVTFTTEHLQYDMATEEFSNDDLVQITLGENFIEGRGLRANIKTSTLELEREFHGTVAP